MSKDEKKTKKQIVLERVKKVQRILEQERIHEDNRKTAKEQYGRKDPVLTGGYSQSSDTGVIVDIRDKTSKIRDRIQARRKRAQARWHGR